MPMNGCDTQIFTGAFDDDTLVSVDPETRRAEDGTLCYKILAKKYSHWSLDGNGTVIMETDTTYKVKDGWYGYTREFTGKDTAFIVMDPWIDCSDPVLNDYFGKNCEGFTLPLMQAAAAAGHHIIVMTNDPGKIKFNTRITPGLEDLAAVGRADVIYHQNHTPETFYAYLGQKNITNLIYTGYCSNMCVMFRPMGIVRMKEFENLKFYFVPQCAMAMEHAETWETRSVHRYTTLNIAQLHAGLLSYEDLMNAFTM